jgi:hypothetical protein
MAAEEVSPCRSTTGPAFGLTASTTSTNEGTLETPRLLEAAPANDALEVPMNPSQQLQEATVQDIQLELIRRTRFNTFDGEVICALLARYRDYWRAALLDRPGIPNYRTQSLLLTAGLIKLRDLEDNIWNADTLFVLTHTPEQARELAAAFEESETGAMPTVLEDREETDMALGTGRQTYGLLQVWWD